MEYPITREPITATVAPAVFRPDFAGRGLGPWLMELCESNYFLLQSLCGRLSDLPDCWTSSSEDVTLILRSSHRGPYTTDIFYGFDLRETFVQIPARLYHDARLCDAHGMRSVPQRSGGKLPGTCPPVGTGREEGPFPPRHLEQQWKDNLVMRRWLEYAFSHKHFSARSLAPRIK